MLVITGYLYGTWEMERFLSPKYLTSTHWGWQVWTLIISTEQSSSLDCKISLFLSWLTELYLAYFRPCLYLSVSVLFLAAVVHIMGCFVSSRGKLTSCLPSDANPAGHAIMLISVKRWAHHAHHTEVLRGKFFRQMKQGFQLGITSLGAFYKPPTCMCPVPNSGEVQVE